jgi:hypothetical protein
LFEADKYRVITFLVFKVMIRNSLFLLVAFFAALTVYGKKTQTETQENLTGIWIVDTTIVKQTVDSVSTTKTYLAGDTAVTFVQRPQKITVTANRIVFKYSKGTRSGTYTVEGNKLLVRFMTHLAEYRYSLIEPGKLELYHTAQYVIDGEHQAEEQCIFKCEAVSETEN